MLLGKRCRVSRLGLHGRGSFTRSQVCLQTALHEELVLFPLQLRFGHGIRVRKASDRQDSAAGLMQSATRQWYGLAADMRVLVLFSMCSCFAS